MMSMTSTMDTYHGFSRHDGHDGHDEHDGHDGHDEHDGPMSCLAASRRDPSLAGPSAASVGALGASANPHINQAPAQGACNTP